MCTTRQRYHWIKSKLFEESWKGKRTFRRLALLIYEIWIIVNGDVVDTRILYPIFFGIPKSVQVHQKLMACPRSVSLLLPKNNSQSRRLFSTTLRKDGHGPPTTALYRNTAPPVTYGPRITYLNAVRTFVWTVLFYKAWYDPWSAMGHPKYSVPDPSKWTDEELGIPPDDYDEVV